MSRACSALYITNLRGDILLEKRYRDDVTREVADLFRTIILAAKDREAVLQTPVRTLGSHTFIYMRHSDVYLVCITLNNPNTMKSFQFMSSLVSLLCSYFEADVCESSVKANFVLIYELLDEAMDFGIPQLTDPALLKSLILQRCSRLDLILGLAPEGAATGSVRRNFLSDPRVQSMATIAVTGAVGWRREGIRYKKNTLYIDVVEQVDFLASAAGTVQRCEVLGKLLVRCMLSGMPEIQLGLGDSLSGGPGGAGSPAGDSNVTFHQCVNLATYEATKAVTFVPPDGEFELMRYRCTENVNVPFKVIPTVVEVGRSKMEFNVHVRSLCSAKHSATSVCVIIPVPEMTSSAKTSVTTGKAKYDGARHVIVWKISKFAGGADHTLRADVNLIVSAKAGSQPWSKPPIQMQFQVPMYSASTLRVAYLKIMERRLGSTYKADKWVRKMCQSGDFAVKMA